VALPVARYMPRRQFTLRVLLALLFGAACFFGGIHFERERRRREDEASALARAQTLLDQKLREIAALRQEILSEKMRADSLLHAQDGQSVKELQSEIRRCEERLKQLRGY
jgi:Tfp pilus assembly protein PilN